MESLPLNRSIFQNVKEAWPIIVVIVGLVVGWTRFESRLDNYGERIERLEKEQAEHRIVIQEIKISLTKIDGKLDAIKEQIDNK